MDAGLVQRRSFWHLLVTFIDWYREDASDVHSWHLLGRRRPRPRWCWELMRVRNRVSSALSILAKLSCMLFYRIKSRTLSTTFQKVVCCEATPRRQTLEEYNNLAMRTARFTACLQQQTIHAVVSQCPQRIHQLRWRGRWRTTCS